MTLDQIAAAAAPPSPTEKRMPRSAGIDRMSTRRLLELINDEDATVPNAVRAVLPELTELVDRAAAAVRAGGSIHYFGAGTSGRFGALDAAEVPPTYGVREGLIVAHMAGGPRAMTAAIEDAEDSEDAGRNEAITAVSAGDVVFGLAASGRTPYVAGALIASHNLGAYTVAVTSNPAARISELADLHLCLSTGSEVVTGSTRMKAGTAQKLLLHSFSTALMVRLGRTYSNLMIDVVPSNEKLRKRVIRLLCEASGRSEHDATDALASADGDAKLALVMLFSGLQVEGARAALEVGGDVTTTLDRIHATERGSAPGNVWLGVDIGASGYRLAIADHDRVIASHRGVAKPRITDHGIDAAAIVHGLDADLQRLRAEGFDGEFDAIAVGCAGGGFFTSNSEALARDLAALTSAPIVHTMSDAVAGYVGAVGLGAGAVLAAGTGAVAVASDGDELWRRLDGLGHLLGDHGSGAWIGQRALQAAAATAAGRPSESPALTAALARRFGDVTTLVRELYASTERSSLLASFVPDVLEAAEGGDPFARQLLDVAAGALSTTLAAAAADIDGPVAAIGGLMTPGTVIRTRVVELLAARGTTVTPSLTDAAAGAAAVARALRSGEVSISIRSQIHTYSMTER